VPERVQVYTAAQVRAAERPLLAAGEPLMDRAAAALAAITQERVDDVSARRGGLATRVLVLAGSGDNGGDALLAAAALRNADVAVLAVGSRVHGRGEAAALSAGARRLEPAELQDAASRFDLIIDGILGIGASADPALRGTAREAVGMLLPAVRAGRTLVIAVDVPSGLHPDDGSADDVVLPATTTVTFGAVKAGLVRGSGPALTGEVILVRIGLEPGLAGMEPVCEASVARIVPR